MNTDKSISAALGIAPTPKQEVEIIPPEKNTVAEVSETGSLKDDDFAFARAKMRDLIDKTTKKLDEFDEIATQLETPRAFEVYGGLVEKTQNLINDLYDLHKKKKEIGTELPDTGNPSVTVEKAVFVGTTAELLSALKKKDEQQ